MHNPSQHKLDIFVTATPALCVALVVPFAPLAPPLKVFVVVLLAVKLISSVPILISPDDGKAAVFARTIFVVVVFVKAVCKVFGSESYLENKLPIVPKPPSCCAPFFVKTNEKPATYS